MSSLFRAFVRQQHCCCLPLLNEKRKKQNAQWANFTFFRFNELFSNVKSKMGILTTSHCLIVPGFHGLLFSMFALPHISGPSHLIFIFNIGNLFCCHFSAIIRSSFSFVYLKLYPYILVFIVPLGYWGATLQWYYVCRMRYAYQGPTIPL